MGKDPSAKRSSILSLRFQGRGCLQALRILAAKSRSGSSDPLPYSDTEICSCLLNRPDLNRDQFRLLNTDSVVAALVAFDENGSAWEIGMCRLE